MNKPVNRPGRVAPSDLDTAIEQGVERADQVNELSNDELNGVNGGIITPGKVSLPDPLPDM